VTRDAFRCHANCPRLRGPMALSMLVFDRAGFDWGSMDFCSAFVSDPDAAPAVAEFGPLLGQVARQFIGGRFRPFSALKQHASGIGQNLAIEQQIKKETAHAGHDQERRRQPASGRCLAQPGGRDRQAQGQKASARCQSLRRKT
jgi:hypothetical protein